MSAVSIDKFFRILEFFRNNPYDTVTSKLSNESYLVTDKLKLFQNTLTLDPRTSLAYPKDTNVITTALQAREKVRTAYAKTMIPGSYAYNTPDIDLFRELSIDWTSAVRTQKDLMRQVTDAFALDDEDLDKAIRGFGIGFLNKKSLPNIVQRAVFFYALCDLYKVKGAPYSIIRALQLAGLSNTVIREYWVERDRTRYKELLIRGTPVFRHYQYFDPESRQYVFDDPEHHQDVILSWENFSSRLADIGEPHWWYRNSEIIAIDFNPDVYLKLPSITPYFGVDHYPDIEKYTVIISIIEKILSEQFNQYLHGDKDLLPQEIGVDDYNQELSQRNLIVEGYDKPLTLLEAYLAFCYCRIRNDEYKEYLSLRNYMLSRSVSMEDTEYKYPWAYQELIYQLYQRKDETVFGPITVDHILRKYPGRLSKYYIAQNELYRWWLQRPSENNEGVHTVNNLPDIFFSEDYEFKYQIEQTNTSNDKILFYNGPRLLDFKQVPFEYKETIQDYKINSNKTPNRIPDLNSESFVASNYHATGEQLTIDYHLDYLNTYFKEISWTSPTYTENIQHDGSSILPNTIKRYPVPCSWNWAIDSLYYYISYTPTKWARCPIESFWDDDDTVYCLPDDGPETQFNFMGSKYYYDQYIYVYVSQNKWIRFVVETDWDYCSAPILPDGSLKPTSKLAKQIVIAKIPKITALKYLENAISLETDRITLTEDPFEINGSPISKDMSINDFQKYIDLNSATVEPTGYIIRRIDNFIYEDSIYFYILDKQTNAKRWVRKAVETEWDTNGSQMYEGEYKFPNLDLTNRYDAERILRGKYVLNLEELDALTQTQIDDIIENNNSHILVSKGQEGYPEIWSYNQSTHTWFKNPINIVNDIYLGFNNGLIDWIDNYRVQDEADYDDVSNTFLYSISSYIKTQFNDYDLDIAGLYRSIANSGLYKDIIEFYKPKRARLLYFSLNLEFDDRGSNSLFLDERPEITKIIQENRDYAPRNDLVFVNKRTRGLIKEVLHNDDATNTLQIPVGAALYLNGFDDDTVNGFYFPRQDLDKYGFGTYINHHNMILTRIVNDLPIYGYNAQWVILRRKEYYDWCNCIYANYDSSLSNNWFTKDLDPSSSTPLTGTRVISVDQLTIDDLRQCDITVNIDYVNPIQDSLLDCEYPWNTLHPRSEPAYPNESGVGKRLRKTQRFDTVCSSLWGPVLCKDIYNIRRVYPSNSAAGTPVNLVGGRLYNDNPANSSLADQDQYDSFNIEYRHSFRRRYPYYDSLLKIHNATNNLQSQAIIDAQNYYKTSKDYVLDHVKSLFVAGQSDGSTVIYYHTAFRIVNQDNIRVDLLNPVTKERTIVDSSNYTITSNYIRFINGFIPTADYFIEIVSIRPCWWEETETTWRTGPDHKPVYIGVQEIVYDCYPCHDWDDCCDYYDIGCRHDGLDNPYEAVWDPLYEGTGSWLATDVWAHNLNDVSFDTNTNYHPAIGYISDNITIEQYTEESSWGRQLQDPGDTFCTECDQPTFTPDNNVFRIPTVLRENGIFHESIFARDFENSDLNGEWVSIIDDQPYQIPTNFINDNIFKYGYVKKDNSEYLLIHVFHKESGYHFWEILNNGNQVYRSKLKEKLHTLDDIIDENIGNWKVEANNFLNGNDVDVVEDDWCELISESEFINKDINEINQISISGKFVTSLWISFTSEQYEAETGEFSETTYGRVGDLYYDTSRNYLYVCVISDKENALYQWNRVTAEHSWVGGPIDVTQGASGSSNYFGYFYKDNYLYLFVPNYSGWIRVSVSENEPSTILATDYTNIWRIEENIVFRYVNAVVALDGIKEEQFVCGDPVPYLETYDGIRALYYHARCKCTIREKVYIEISEFTIDINGNYILIESQDSTEHRYIDCRDENGDRNISWAIAHYQDELLPDEIWQQTGSDYYEINIIEDQKIYQDNAHNHEWFN